MSELNELLALAGERISELSATVVGITGSVGKSAVRQFIFEAMSGSFRVHSLAVGMDSLNESCRAIADTPDGANVILLEFRTRQKGEIGELARMFHVSCGVITDDGMLAGGAEIAESPALARLFFNKDHEALARAVAAIEDDGGRIKKFGAGFADADVKISDVRQSVSKSGAPELSVLLAHKGEKYGCCAKILGRQNARNIALAFSVAVELGANPGDICSRMASVQLPNGSGRIHRTAGGGFLIDESCGASPDSVSYSLKNIIELETPNELPKFAILGGMRELGLNSLYWHEVIMSRASLLDGVYLIGSEWDGVVTEQSSLRGRWRDADEFMGDFDPRSLGGSVTLLKGSKHYGMGRILNLLYEPLEARECL
ncbi:MAG: hypothetical protein LBT31_04410 [Synergistaceae bacterium]|jgi:UDP-N-acetylmuramoyl-tripeptide--D-alanyl-D-alanine ligase|nr:hypothetical protein [Synergistaceae bacterium]